jgi:hypothetical protein
MPSFAMFQGYTPNQQPKELAGFLMCCSLICCYVQNGAVQQVEWFTPGIRAVTRNPSGGELRVSVEVLSNFVSDRVFRARGKVLQYA